MDILPATPEQDNVLVRHYLAIWESYGVPLEHFGRDAKANIQRFLDTGRLYRELASFVAVEGDIAAGSISCQVQLSPYPEVLKSTVRKPGYIWSVFVEPPYRRRGISTELIRHAVKYLRSIKCTTVVLHASEDGESIYASLGFKLAKEMRLELD